MSASKNVSDFNDFLEKATSPLQLEPNRDAMNHICNMIDTGKIKSEDAVQAIHGKIVDENPHVVYYALEVLETVFLSCGNLVHRIICTQNYMHLLKDIIKTTEHKKIRDKIFDLLEDWTDKFKYLPNYCAPQKLLESLQSDGYVFPKFEMLQVTNEMHVDMNAMSGINNFECESTKSETSTNVDLKDVENSECDNTKSEIFTDVDLVQRDKDFKNSLEEYQKRKKLDYKKYLKSQGIPTSSDEEDDAIIKQKKTGISNGWQSKDVRPTQSITRPHKLPKELEQLKIQRHQLNAGIQEVRSMKHKNFLDNCSDLHNTELNQCKDKNCKDCEKYKRKVQDEQAVIPKRWPLEIRKVKESRQSLKNSFEEVKELKKQAYYSKKANDGSSSTNNNRNEVLLHQIGKVETEDDELQRAITLSQMENTSSHNTFDGDDEVQQAINLSFTEVEEKSFPCTPKLDDEEYIQLCFAKQLSLDEADNKNKVSEYCEDPNQWEKCNICLELNPLKCFMPCNHKCICANCAESYCAQICPICRKYYTSILWGM